MLVELNIKNFAIIEDLKVNFTKGLNIITGETGAGKSILIEAIGIILGSRSSREYVQTGYSKAFLEGVFYIEDRKGLEPLLDEYGIDLGEDRLLIISKEISLNGPSLSRVNGRNLTLNMLKNITRELIDIFGQHEHQSLLDVSNHQLLIDGFGDESFYQLKKDVEDLYGEWMKEKRNLKKYSLDAGEREREIDILNFQIDEIKEARLGKEDEENVEREYKRLSHVEEISQALDKSLSFFNSEDFNNQGILNLMNKSILEINNAKKLDDNLESLHGQLENINYELQDIYVDLRDYLNSVDLDSERLSFLTDRINLLNKLKKKYGKTIPSILEFMDSSEKRLNDLLNFEREYEKTKNNLKILEERLKSSSDQLTIKRKELSLLMEEKITEELKSLNMKNVKFKVFFHDIQAFTAEGQDKIEFLISTNPGETLKPLARIVSGGEMSRIMLAFKSTIAFAEGIPTLIFDEIDTGISGRTAQIVGEKIYNISRNHQVISVSHLPQIAALADSHFAISKNISDQKSLTKVNRLSEQGRIEEMARLLGGVNLTETTLEHAREMIAMSQMIKKNFN